MNDFDYQIRLDIFMRNMIKDLLKKVIQSGFEGEHHFFLTFNTQFPGIILSDKLKEKYPEHMTIVLQHQYYDLQVTDEYFSVKLNFASTLEQLQIPFLALIFFKDPCSNFSFPFIKVETNSTHDLEYKKPKVHKIEFNKK